MSAPPPPYAQNDPGYPPPKAGEAGYPPAQPGYPAQPAYPQQPGYPPQPGYPAQPGYAVQPGAPVQTTTIIQQPSAVVIGAPVFGDHPVSMTCPNCRSAIVTGMRFEPGTLTWLACLGLCLVGCDLGCCFIPFCVDGMQDAVHTCPACHRQLGVYRRM